MFHTARTSARTLLVAAGTAGFVALGAGVAGADTLGGVTDGLPLGDLGNRVPAVLTEGVSTPLGDLVKVQPGEISAQPDIQHQSGQSAPVGTVVGDTVSADTPVTTGKDNAGNVGPLDLGKATETLPLSEAGGAVDPVSMLLGGTGLLDGLSLDGGQTLPLSAASSPLNLAEGASVVDDTVTELGTRAQSGLHQPGLDVVGLDDLGVKQLGETVPMSGPVGLDAGENADLTGGLTTLLPKDVKDTLHMSGPSESQTVGAAEDAVTDTVGEVRGAVSGLGVEDTLSMSGPSELQTVGAAEDAVTDTVGDVRGAVSGLGVEDTLSMSGAGTDLVGDLLPKTPGGDLVDVQGLPELGQPEVAPLPLASELPTEELTGGDLPLELPLGL
ncbi:hypothetical protein [Nocardiopsis sp. L17-MgMaSL7]|uniref:hypothetical protein n=1 Tax=Nocardiopsis sp. L17-MgMaSL7 TaxID=1938893 RepID=UPI000D715674|nr:hypothetical protein [Nocardiopsis sp. L17-MgMaSL7]PWV48467.1 hypothetical protein BDW27_11019 [Nocardiopsis sp. L17-MgMaSL7]